jgi:S1-C subfamily serine protease
MDFYTIASCKNQASGTLVTTLGKIVGNVERHEKLNLIANIRGKIGYSGAPFVVKNGVCGILTGFEKATGDAIIAHISHTVFQKLHKGKKVRKKDLKIYITDLTKENARMLNIDLKNIPRGILVTQSENKHIAEWDIITHINGVSTSTVEEFLEVVSKIYQNEEMTIEKITNFEIQSITL